MHNLQIPGFRWKRPGGMYLGLHREPLALWGNTPWRVPAHSCHGGAGAGPKSGKGSLAYRLGSCPFPDRAKGNARGGTEEYQIQAQRPKEHLDRKMAQREAQGRAEGVAVERMPSWLAVADLLWHPWKPLS